jgi:hypothetical protein
MKIYRIFADKQTLKPIQSVQIVCSGSQYESCKTIEDVKELDKVLLYKRNYISKVIGIGSNDGVV